jgi:sortase A
VKKYLPEILIGIGVLMLVLTYGPVIYAEVVYQIKQIKNQRYGLNENDGITDSPFARLISSRPILIEPVNTSFSLVIEKIGVNVPVVKNVPVTNEDTYIASLKYGIAHASTSPYPSIEPGNVYLFAHSSVNFWRLGKYAQVFNLLRKLEPGDRAHVFYDDKVYVYEVFDKQVYKGFNTYPIRRKTLEPILTLQTCDPPGTTINRMVVTAKLISVDDL